MGKLKAFTLVEIMVVMAIFAIVSSAVVSVYFQLVRAANRATIAAEVEQSASYAMEIMVRDIREAGCVEENSGILGLRDSECTAVVITFEAAAGEGGVTNLVKTQDESEQILNNPDKTTVNSLSFSVDPSGQSVMIDLVMESVRPAAHSEFRGEISLHETVSLRSY